MNYKKKYLKYKKKYINIKKYGGSNQQYLYNIAKTHLLDVRNPKILKYKREILGEQMYNSFIERYLLDNLENIHDLDLLSEYLENYIEEKLKKRESIILNRLSESFKNKHAKNPFYQGTYYKFLTDLEKLIYITK